MLPDLLETADLQDSSCREFLLAVLETEVKGRNERRRKRNYSAAHFPPNIRPLEEFDPEELESGITHAQLSVLKELSWLDNCGTLSLRGLRASARLWSPVVWGCRLSTAAIRYVLRR